MGETAIRYKVLYICNYAANYSGNFIASLVTLSKKIGVENVCYLFPKQAREKEWIRILNECTDSIYYCDFDRKSMRVMCKQLKNILKNDRLIVHTHFVEGAVLLPIKQAFGNIICHYHMTVPDTTLLKRKVKRILLQIIYRKVQLVGVSQAVTDDLSSYFPSCCCECIPNAIDFRALSREESDPNLPIVREQDKFNILIHGTHFERKGVDLAIQAVEELIKENSVPELNLYITSHHTEDAKRKACALTNDEKAIHVIDVVENVGGLYRNVDVFISPSRDEAFGYAVVEALYCGCQVAASNVPGQNTMRCIPGLFWFEKEDISGLKQAILDAFLEKKNGCAEQKNLIQKEFVQKKYCIDEWCDNNLKLYERQLRGCK